MPKIEWSSKLSVNISVFDDDHQKLVDLLNKLYEAIVMGQVDSVVPMVLLELVDYTKVHFKKEEAAFEKYGYPSFEEHKKVHDDFVKYLDDFVEQYKSGTASVGIPVFNMLFAWVQDHIMKADKAYTEFLTNAGMRQFAGGMLT